MFGKRANPGVSVKPTSVPAPQGVPSSLPDISRSNSDIAAPVAKAAPDQRPESYFQTKSMIFGALIEAIDLAALSKLDQDSAREEFATSSTRSSP